MLYSSVFSVDRVYHLGGVGGGGAGGGVWVLLTASVYDTTLN